MGQPQMTDGTETTQMATTVNKITGKCINLIDWVSARVPASLPELLARLSNRSDMDNPNNGAGRSNKI